MGQKRTREKQTRQQYYKKVHNMRTLELQTLRMAQKLGVEDSALDETFLNLEKQTQNLEHVEKKVRKLVNYVQAISEGHQWFEQRSSQSKEAFLQSAWFRDYEKLVEEAHDYFQAQFLNSKEMEEYFPQKQQVEQQLLEIRQILRELAGVRDSLPKVSLINKILNYFKTKIN